MYKNKKVVAIIPARGGSKRVPKKNIRKLAEKPLIVWSIEAAQQSAFIDKIIVSTDDQSIAKVSNQHGASIPFIRPASLATDTASSTDVIIHALEELAKQGQSFDYFLLLQPTSPFRNGQHINEAFSLMERNDSKGIISVSLVDHPIEWTNTLPEDNSFDGFISKEVLSRRSQDFEPRYQLNGAIYIVPVDEFLKEKTVYLAKGMTAYRMDRLTSMDIDTEEDFVLAQALSKKSWEKKQLETV